MLRSARVLTVSVLACCGPPGDAPPDYRAAFDSQRIVDWRLAISSDNWIGLLVDPQTYVAATLSIDDAEPLRVGVRLLGRQRRLKRSLRIRFDAIVPQQRYFGLKRVTLHAARSDPSMVRETLALSLFRQAGVAAPRSSFAWLEINDEGGGLFTLVEQVDKKFLEDRFGEDRGVLYKVERGGTLVAPTGQPGALDPTIYELKSDLPSYDNRHLLRLMKLLTDGSTAQLEQRIGAQLAVQSWLSALVVNSFLVNLDAYPGTGDNYYLYRDTRGRFHYIPWDLQRALGNYHGASCGLTTDEMLAFDPLLPTCGGPRPLIDRLLAVDSLRQRYRDRLRELLDSVLSAARIAPQIEALRQRVAGAAQRDQLKPFSNDRFSASFTSDVPEGNHPARVPGLQPFVEQREQRVQALLEAHQ